MHDCKVHKKDTRFRAIFLIREGRFYIDIS